MGTSAWSKKGPYRASSRWPAQRFTAAPITYAYSLFLAAIAGVTAWGGLWLLSAIFAILAAVLLAYTRSCAIVIEPDAIVYRSFGRSRRMSFSDMAAIGWRRSMTHQDARRELVVEPKGDSDATEITINPHMFSEKTIRRVIEQATLTAGREGDTVADNGGTSEQLNAQERLVHQVLGMVWGMLWLVLGAALVLNRGSVPLKLLGLATGAASGLVPAWFMMRPRNRDAAILIGTIIALVAGVLASPVLMKVSRDLGLGHWCGFLSAVGWGMALYWRGSSRTNAQGQLKVRAASSELHNGNLSGRVDPDNAMDLETAESERVRRNGAARAP